MEKVIAPQLFEALAETAFDPLILLDQDLRVISANIVARELFGQDIVGEEIAGYFDDPDLIDMLQCASLGRSYPPEVQFVIGNRAFRARCERVEYLGASILAVALQEVTQLIRLNRARRDMVANISHELRAPISTIRLLHDTINRPGTGKKQRQTILRKIGRQLDTLQRIVDDMHDLSMIESGQAIMRLVPMPLPPLIDETLEHLEGAIKRRKLGTNIDISDDLFVLVDEAQIRRVFANLIDNAVKFSPKKSEIVIKAAQYPEDADFVQVCIEDSGPGIPETERDRIFERFYQLDQARTIGQGSGLGLSIAKHIIEAHNGTLWVKDSPLGGTCMCFTLMNGAPAA